VRLRINVEEPQNLEPWNLPQATTMSEAAYNYRNLKLWQEAQDVAGQLTRAAGSISANVAEGHGRFSYAAYKNHLSIAKGSACEADSWLDLLRQLDFVAPDRESVLHQRLFSLIGLLTHRIKQLESQMAKRDRPLAEPRAIYGSDLNQLPDDFDEQCQV